ncbi:MAG: two-component regulator propeller domain-containing protein [Tannerellaceae bacterium]
MKKHKYITLLIYLFIASCCYANEFLFTHINVDNGLSHASATSIYQDKLGSIWFGNKYLNVYSDNTLRSYSLSDYLPGAEHNNIHAICGDGEEKLYMLSNTRLISYDIRTERFVDTRINTHTICYTRSKLLYCLQNKVLSYTDNAPSKQICALPDTSGAITALLFGEEALWIGTDRGLYCYRGNALSLMLPNVDVSCLFFDSRRNLWVGTTADGAKSYCPQTSQWTDFREESTSSPLINNQVRCINEDGKKNVWIGTYKGLTIVSGTSERIDHVTYNSASAWSLSHSSVYAICRDQQGGMWVGTYYGGIDYFNPVTEQYTYYAADDAEPSALHGFIFGNMTEDAKGNLYIGTENGGVNILNKQTHRISHLKAPEGGEALHTVKAVWFDREEERLFIGTFQEGLTTYTPGNGQFKPIQSEWMAEKKHQIILRLQPWKEFVIVLTQGGLFKLDRNTLELSPLLGGEEALAEKNYMQSMYISRANTLWLSSSDEYVQAIDLQTHRVSSPDTLKSIIDKATVYSMCEDEQGRIYFVVEGKGIVRYDPKDGEVVRYSKETGELLANPYHQLLILPKGKLLATFNHGITLLDPESKKSNHTFFNKTTPLSSLNINCGVYASPPTNELFIGGIKGLISLKEGSLHAEKRPYHLWFSELSINNVPVSIATHSSILKESIAFTRTLEVAYDQNNLSFEFATSNYSSDNDLFLYKLEGLDKEWTPAKHKSFTYTALPPGSYNLLVQESENSEKQISLRIIVHAPFYASVPALLLYLLLFILLLVWLIRFNRSRAALKVSLAMEHREKERIEELNQIKLRFFTNISHEIRTPITLISNQLEMILMNSGLPVLLKKKLNKIYKHTLYVQELITEILDFRRQEQKELPLHVSQRDLIAFLKEIFNIFTEYAENRKVAYTFEASEEELDLWFDPVQMKKVFTNLLSNAFKHTPAGGSISLSVNRRSADVEIIVSDTGCGIPDDQKETIFERFYQVDGEQAGTGSGIGLALTRGIVLQHQGTIRVSSQAGELTRFIVTLLPGESQFTAEQKKSHKEELLPSAPLSLLLDDLDTEETPRTREESPEEMTEKRYSILLVEDNTELLALLEEAFEPIYRVYKATNGEIGLQVACEVIPDLIISDVMMPRLSGYELCQQLKNNRETSHIPILLLTAKVSLEQEFEGLQCGADSYITKPFNLELLLLKCKNFMKSRQKLQAHYLSSQSTLPTAELATNRLDQELLDQSVKLIESNLQNSEFNIDKWCAEVRISRSKLYAKIKAISGLTLNDFILQIKLNKSAELLIQASELSISEISWKCGFATPGYFGKCFKGRYHVTPGEYRNEQAGK